MFAHSVFFHLLEQPCNLTAIVHINLFSGRDFWETGHGHNVAGQHHDEACACGYTQIFDGDGEVLGSAEFGRIIREGILRFRHTDGTVAKTEFGQSSDLLFGCR